MCFLNPAAENETEVTTNVGRWDNTGEFSSVPQNTEVTDNADVFQTDDDKPDESEASDNKPDPRRIDPRDPRDVDFRVPPPGFPGMGIPLGGGGNWVNPNPNPGWGSLRTPRRR